jgi:hypothetical protein
MSDPKQPKSSLHATAATKKRVQALATHYGTTQLAVTEVALQLLEERVRGTDMVQVPELISAIGDLEDGVRTLLVQGEHLEQLMVELMALEIDRMEAN